MERKSTNVDEHQGKLKEIEANIDENPRTSSKINEHQIERTTEEIAAANVELPTPYWDPTLRRDRRKRRHLLDHLARMKLVSFRRRIKARAAMFFVNKKPGPDGEELIRLILDARQACALHHAPPKVHLGSAGAISQIDMSDERLAGQAAFSGDCGGVADVPVLRGRSGCRRRLL